MYSKELGYTFTAGTALVAAATGQLGLFALAVGAGLTARSFTTRKLKAHNEAFNDEAEGLLKDQLRQLSKDDKEGEEGQLIRSKLEQLKKEKRHRDESADWLGGVAGVGVFADPIVGGLVALGAVSHACAQEHRIERARIASYYEPRSRCKKVRAKPKAEVKIEVQPTPELAPEIQI